MNKNLFVTLCVGLAQLCFRFR